MQDVLFVLYLLFPYIIMRLFMRTLINDISEKNKIEIMMILFFVSIFIYIFFTSLLFPKMNSSIAFGIRVILFSTIIAVSDILVDQILIDFGLDDSLSVIFVIAVIGFIFFVWISRYRDPNELLFA